MAYATINELKVRLGQDYAGLYGNDETGTATAQADLEAAAAEIDAAAGCRYETPVASERAEALLRDWNLTLCEERAGFAVRATLCPINSKCVSPLCAVLLRKRRPANWSCPVRRNLCADRVCRSCLRRTGLYPRNHEGLLRCVP